MRASSLEATCVRSRPRALCSAVAHCPSSVAPRRDSVSCLRTNTLRERRTAATLTDDLQMDDFRDRLQRRDDATVVTLIGRVNLSNFQIPMLLISLAEQMCQMVLAQRRVLQQVHVEQARDPARFVHEVDSRPGDLQQTDRSARRTDAFLCTVHAAGCG